MTTKAGAKSEVDILIRAARANGYKTIPAQGGHKKIVDHRGKPVVDDNGPLIISSSPSDARWREMTVKRWIAAKVIKADPFKGDTPSKAVRKLTGGATSGKDGGTRLTDPEIQQKKVDAIKARFAEHRALSQKVREDLEPIIVKLGGWDKHGVKSQMGDVIFWFNEWRGHVERFPSASAASSALANLKKGNALSDKSRTAIGYFVDELKKAADPQARYFELLRLSKGLPAREDEPVRGGSPLSDPPPKEEREKQADKTETNGHGKTEQIGPSTKPSLALQVVAEMMVGRTEVDDAVLRLGERIQDMELRERGMLT